MIPVPSRSPPIFLTLALSWPNCAKPPLPRLPPPPRPTPIACSPSCCPNTAITLTVAPRRLSVTGVRLSARELCAFRRFGRRISCGFWRDGFRCCPSCLAVPVAGLVEPGAVGSWLRLVGFSRGAWLGGGLVRRISCGFWRRQNQPASFPHWRAATDPSRTQVQLGSSATRHHRKIRRLFCRSSPAKIRKKSSACRCCAQQTRPGPALHKRATSWRIAVFMLGSMVFHTGEKPSRKVPHCGKKVHPAWAGFSTPWKNGTVFSTQWKNFARFFHTMEQL